MDNQIIKRTGFSGIFLETFYALNKLNRSMGDTLTVNYEEDWTIIPVKVMIDNQLSHLIESGVVLDCQHIEVENDGELYNNCVKCGEAVIIEETEYDFDESDEWREREANDCN